MIVNLDKSIQLADKALRKRGRISLTEIRRHVPFVDGEMEAIAVAQNLIDKYDDLEIVEDKWNLDFILYLPRSSDKRGRAGERRRRSRRTVAG